MAYLVCHASLWCHLQSHMADPLQDMQKQRLLQPDSPRKSDSPTSHVAQRPNQLQPLVNYSPRQVQQLPQQSQTEQPLQQLPQQADQPDQWHWQHQRPSPRQPQAFEVMSQQPTVNQLAQNGTANGQQSVARPPSALFAGSLGSDSQPQTQSASQAPDTLPRPRTATASASPRTTNEQQAFAVIRSKNVSWQASLFQSHFHDMHVLQRHCLLLRLNTAWQQHIHCMCLKRPAATHVACCTAVGILQMRQNQHKLHLSDTRPSHAMGVQLLEAALYMMLL